ncbi:MAG: hypothetical protein QM621_07255 [Aeromicrobium sp.]|uniref:hypothetical protein n=1 Tax=Aeromicrobium sp. TaxID=1871063 RepID=UPI0039E53B03
MVAAVLSISLTACGGGGGGAAGGDTTCKDFLGMSDRADQKAVIRDYIIAEGDENPSDYVVGVDRINVMMYCDAYDEREGDPISKAYEDEG